VSGGICFAGLDVHAHETAAAAVRLGSGEVFRARLAGGPDAAIEWLRSLPGPVRAVDEAGPTGFGLARAARAAGIDMIVCAPCAIPRQPGDRVKTDSPDALKLARLHAAGQLRPVVVAGVELEALRDLVRAREDLRGDLMAARHRISTLLLRRGLGLGGTGPDVEPATSAVAIGGQPPRSARRRRARRVPGLPRGAARAPRASGRADRRAGRMPAVGDHRGEVALPARHRHHDRGRAGRRDRRHHGLRAPQTVGQLCKPGALGAVHRRAPPARHDHQGRLWSRPPAADRGRLALPPPTAGVPGPPPPPRRPTPGDDRRSWRAQLRLHRRWAHLDTTRGKRRTTVAVAVARELACFVWEIARQPD
jgi:transposase